MENSASIAIDRFCALYAAGGGARAVAHVLPSVRSSLERFADYENQALLDYVDALCFGDLNNLLFTCGRIDLPLLGEALEADRRIFELLVLPREQLPPAWFVEPWLGAVIRVLQGECVVVDEAASEAPLAVRERFREHLTLRLKWQRFLERRPELVGHVDPAWVCYVPGPCPSGEFMDQPSFQHYLFRHSVGERDVHILDRYPNHLANGDAAYHADRERSMAVRARRLGSRRAIACHIDATHRRWRSPHKQGAPTAPSFPVPDVVRGRRPLPAGRLRLAHVTGQLVDANHAPSRVCRTLFAHHDRERFELSLLVSEIFVPRIDEYPLSCCLSAPSPNRAPRTLHSLRNRGVSVWVEETLDRYEATVQRLVRRLEEVDIAVFHGPNPVHLLAAAGSDVPVRIFFEHSELPPPGLFDLVIASDVTHARRPDYVVVPFVVDQRADWEDQAYSPTVWGLPEGVRILTTTSLSLGSRLSTPMLRAVRRILEAVPEAVYAPLGPISAGDERRCRDELGLVGERLRFMGEKPNTAQWVRSAALYLNEFPFGGCLSVLEALAAGVPVVSLFDPEGPPQGRYAAEFFGRHADSPDDYVCLACQLLSDQEMHRCWSTEALAAYRQQGTPESYVARLEALFLKHKRSGSTDAPDSRGPPI